MDSTVIGVLLVALGALIGWLGYQLARSHRELTSRLDRVDDRLDWLTAGLLARGGPAAGEASPARDHLARRAQREFVVIMAHQGGGFFSVFLKVLGCLDHYPDRAPIAYFNKASFMYWSDAGWNGSTNGWEYYFEPLSEFGLLDVLSYTPHDLASMDTQALAAVVGDNVLVTDHYYSAKVGFAGRAQQRHRGELHQLYTERIRVKAPIREKVERFVGEHFGAGRVVGIHYRGTDKFGEISALLGRKPRSSAAIGQIDVDGYIDAALAAAGTGETRFFLATEDELALDRARDRLGGRLVYTPATRSRSEVAPHWDIGGPALGEEALIDCLLLARCDHLVHGLSNLSWAALIMNPSLPNTDLHEPYVSAP